ncbi:MAG: two-component regulator propeller domain-containing protein [Bacteroidota bacterium]
MNNRTINLILASILIILTACETGKLPPKCCPEPAGQLLWETYTTATGELMDNQINAIGRDQDAKIWIATPNGLSLWDGQEWNQLDRPFNLAPWVSTYDLLVWEDSLYLASQYGVSVWRGYWEALLGPDSVNIVAVDPEGGLWAASQNAQLWHYKGEAFYEVESPNDPQYAITFVFEEENGRLWVGAEDGQVHIRETGIWRSEDLGAIPSAITQNPNGQVWVATQGAGALIYLNGQQIYQFGQNEGALSNTIHTILFDERNRLWLGTDKGLNVISGLDTPDDVLINFYDLTDGLPSNNILEVLIVSETDWWIGTDRGLARRFVK